jgi:hypothetical protein
VVRNASGLASGRLHFFVLAAPQDPSRRLDEAHLRQIWSFLCHIDLRCVTDTNRRWRRSTDDFRLQRASVPLDPFAFVHTRERVVFNVMQSKGPEMFFFGYALQC